jgi:stress-induced morphogen
MSFIPCACWELRLCECAPAAHACLQAFDASGMPAVPEPAAPDGSASAGPAAGSSEVAIAEAGGSSEGGASNTPVADSMRRKLIAELAPLKLEVVDESWKHAGHAGYRGKANYSGETHFLLVVVSARFEGLSSIKRHRLVYSIIDEEMGSPVHAVSLITKTPAEASM